MDNLTHSLIGITVAESIIPEKLRNKESNHVRKAFWFASIGSNNFPDLDFIYTRITEGKIGSLLHHRGHTHTLLIGIFQALFIYWLTQRIFFKNKENPYKRFILFLCIVGMCLHIFADSWNSYGVHPFWPFNSKWFYGDFIFIIEPWIWMSLLPIAFYASENRLWKIVFILFSIIGLVLCLISGLVYNLLTISLGMYLIVNYFLGSKLQIQKYAKLHLGVIAVILIMFKSFALIMQSDVKEYLSTQNTTESNPWKTKDIVLSPFPGNIFCWMVQTVEVNQEDYVTKNGIFSMFPNFISAVECPNRMKNEPTSEMEKPNLPMSNQVLWLNQWRAHLTEWRKLKENCNFQALLKFYRVPFWIKNEKGYWVGDARYDREKGAGFTEMQITDDLTCPKFIPGWDIIRNDL